MAHDEMVDDPPAKVPLDSSYTGQVRSTHLISVISSSQMLQNTYSNIDELIASDEWMKALEHKKKNNITHLLFIELHNIQTLLFLFGIF